MILSVIAVFGIKAVGPGLSNRGFVSAADLWCGPTAIQYRCLIGFGRGKSAVDMPKKRHLCR